MGRVGWFGAGLLLVWASGCGRPPLGQVAGGAGGLSGAQATAVGKHDDPAAPDGPVAADAGATAGPLACENPAPADGGAPPRAREARGDGLWSAPSLPPFPCDPLVVPFFFEQPGPEVAGAYARCASFGAARVASLAPSPDGRLVAMVGTDGIVRVVDVAARMVVWVLAPPRARIDLAAFSPAGDAIVTLARGQREAALWRRDTFEPIWTTVLPGHLYPYLPTGAAAFSPDGRAVLVSPGTDLVLLDAATGAIRATRGGAAARGRVVGAGYGWNGRRIAVAEAPLEGHCVQGASGGAVTILDPETLAPLATPMSWGGRGSDDAPRYAQMLVAAEADLLLTPGSHDDPAMQAFRVSDGTLLPHPALATMPLALFPDGASALLAGAGELQKVSLGDGAVTARIPADGTGPYAVSPDGATVALGGRGSALLGTWNVGAPSSVPVCRAEDRPNGDPTVHASLSANGATVAVDWGTEIRVSRRADGGRISTISHAGDTVWDLSLSPDARYVFAHFHRQADTPTAFPAAVFRTSDGAQVREVGDSFGAGSLRGFAFGPAGDFLFEALFSSWDSGQLVQFPLGEDDPLVFRPIDGNATLLGFSGGCPMLALYNRGVQRWCASCDGPLFAPGASAGGILSNDGLAFAGYEGNRDAGVSLWQLFPEPSVVRVFPPRPEEDVWEPQERPVAVGAAGRQVITGAFPLAPCYGGPGFELRVHDVATNTIVDTLPPGLTSADAELRVLGFGPELWCAR